MVGVPLALNAGNWMYFWAGQLIDEAGLADGVRLQAHTEMNRTMVRCHHGQALDLAARVDQIARAELPSVVAATTRLKTAALFELATRLGALAAGASAEVIDALGRFGASLGTALQMLDDLSGLASAARLDKAHEDLSLGRPTWPWAWLAERQSDADFRALLDARLEIELGPAADAMAKTQLLAETMRLRVGGAGRLRIRALLDLALARLREHFGDAAADSVERDVERLEQSYA
jgi:geranylgeranyl pyrophosphate synthase